MKKFEISFYQRHTEQPVSTHVYAENSLDARGMSQELMAGNDNYVGVRFIREVAEAGSVLPVTQRYAVYHRPSHAGNTEGVIYVMAADEEDARATACSTAVAVIGGKAFNPKEITKIELVDYYPPHLHLELIGGANG